MKQLLIVNSTKAINAKADNNGAAVTPYDFSNLAKGAISFFELGASSLLAAAPTKNFGIALGQGTNKKALIIPEVDLDTLEVVKTPHSAGAVFKATFVVPTPTVGTEYTVILIKTGTVPNERNMWSTTVVATSTTASTVATDLKTAIENKVNDEFPVKVTVSSAKVTIEGLNVGEGWVCKLADGLMGVAFTTASGENQKAVKAVGDKAYVEDLAQRCAADKGFVYLDQSSKDIYPGYPEAVEDTNYTIFNLHFATGRKAGKQTDERVWQYVHIAVPSGGTAYSTIDTILSGAKSNDQATVDPSN